MQRIILNMSVKGKQNRCFMNLFRIPDNSAMFRKSLQLAIKNVRFFLFSLLVARSFYLSASSFQLFYEECFAQAKNTRKSNNNNCDKKTYITKAAHTHSHKHSAHKKTEKMQTTAVECKSCRFYRCFSCSRTSPPPLRARLFHLHILSFNMIDLECLFTIWRVCKLCRTNAIVALQLHIVRC